MASYDQLPVFRWLDGSITRWPDHLLLSYTHTDNDDTPTGNNIPASSNSAQ